MSKKLHSVCLDMFHMLFSNMYFFFFLNQHSPSGKLVQIEYALSAVAAGAPSVGIKGMSVDQCITNFTDPDEIRTSIELLSAESSI